MKKHNFMFFFCEYLLHLMDSFNWNLNMLTYIFLIKTEKHVCTILICLLYKTYHEDF